MTSRTLLAAVGMAALVSSMPALAQGRSGGTPGAGMGATASSARGGMGGTMGVGVGAGPSSPNGVGAGSLVTGLDRAAEATSDNENASAGFATAMEMRAAAQVRRNNARANARAAEKAAEQAKENANENSVVNDD